MSKREYFKKKTSKCIDCEGIIGLRSERCKSCAQKKRWSNYYKVNNQKVLTQSAPKGLQFRVKGAYDYPYVSVIVCSSILNRPIVYKRARFIYAQNFGPIPKGKLIHHKDGDKTNDDPSNLACLTNSEHRKYHRKKK